MKEWVISSTPTSLGTGVNSYHWVGELSASASASFSRSLLPRSLLCIILLRIFHPFPFSRTSLDLGKPGALNLPLTRTNFEQFIRFTSTITL